MIKLVGEARWQQIAFRYFYLQLDHPDCILTATEDEKVIGVLIASSPVCSPSLLVHLRELLGMMWLLGPQFQDSQQIASAVVEALPREPIWYINQLAVLPENQGEGLGSQLLQTLMYHSGSFPVWVDCEQDLEAFYAAAGYQLSKRTSAELSVMMRPAHSEEERLP